MSSSLTPGPDRPLVATYRLQLNAGFTLAHARAQVDYFDQLGVSHLYLSPVLAARVGSAHGYDVVDPSRINPELGTEAELRGLASELHARGMGLIVDIVPNHMATGAGNRYWDDVLMHGARSRYAQWFDVDWGVAHNKVVLPVLGDELERALELGQFGVTLREGETPRVTYFSDSFPLDPASLPPDLQLAQADPEAAADIAVLYSGSAGRHRLRALLGVQHYTLAFWRRRGEINYRRFFDVDGLVALRIDEPDVFREMHALPLRLVSEGVIDGLRVDHVDGLLDPAAYLERLRGAVKPGTPIFVEKILAPSERLPASWPVEGTTGYDFLRDVENVFLDPAGTSRIERFYRRWRRLGDTTFDDIALAAKTATLEGSLRADVRRVVRALQPIVRAEKKRWSPEALEAAVIAFVASMPVYRTYIDGRSPVSDADREAIEHAAADAIRHGASHGIVALIVAVLVDPSTPERLAFAQRLQQLSGPAAAKGVEDTALYVYVPVTSRDEVGAEPDQPIGGAVDSFHRANAERADCRPRSLVATNTHDTKRSADVRARLDALTQVPDEWERAVRRWRKLNSRHRRVVRGRLAPDTNTEYLMYQTIVALWPPPRAGRRSDDLPDRAWRTSACERLRAYALKASREAKTRTSWLDPDAAYERAVSDFVSAILEPAEEAPFLPDVARLVARVAPLGAWNTLSRVALHLTSPGTPDIYQGDELWSFTLVDPDNRAPVDYDARRTALGELDGFSTGLSEAPVLDPFDRRLKLLLTQRLLGLRRAFPDLYGRGSYERLAVRGARAGNVVAFARTLGERQSITIAARLADISQRTSTAEWWRDTVVEMPQMHSPSPWISAIFGKPANVSESDIGVASALGKLPVAVLVN